MGGRETALEARAKHGAEQVKDGAEGLASRAGEVGREVQEKSGNVVEKVKGKMS